MTISDCKLDTIKHIETVRKYIKMFTDRLAQRAIDHDKTKLDTPEVECFAKVNDELAKLTYNSDEYKESLEKLTPALDHHYAKNRHHPQHFEHGIDDMNLVDIVEMFCDWRASTERHHDGNLLKSIEINQKRFNYDDQLKHIFLNTAKLFDENDK